MQKQKKSIKKSITDRKFGAASRTYLKKQKTVLDKEGASQDEIEKAYYELKAAMVTMDNSAGIDATDDSKDLPKEQMTATAGSEQAQEGGEGPASNVLDGNADTIWHTVWAGTPIENHWLNLQLDKPATVSGLRLQQRSGRNGIIREAEIWVLQMYCVHLAKRPGH